MPRRALLPPGVTRVSPRQCAQHLPAPFLSCLRVRQHRTTLVPTLFMCCVARVGVLFFVPLWQNADRKYTPVDPCPRCPPRAASGFGTPTVTTFTPCPHCQAEPRRLMDIPGELLQVPDLLSSDFERVVSRSKASVGPEDLERFVKWTAEFGEEGS